MPAQLPSVQLCPTEHMFAHDPQLSLSLLRSAHPPRQRVCPWAHAHFPLTQEEPGAVHVTEQ